MAARREAIAGEHRVAYELGAAKLTLELAPHRSDPRDAPLSASLDTNNAFVSAAMLSQRAKIFDDELYAAVEKAADEGFGLLGSKRALVAVLASALAPGSSSAADIIHGAAAIDDPSRTLIASAHASLQEFLDDPLRSLPIGFYTASKDLRRIFRRDRYLQTPFRRPETVSTIAAALAPHRAEYEAHLALASKLTNPLRGVGTCLFPASRAPETDLIMKLFAGKPIPESFDLAAELVKQIRARTLSLAPSADSGFYDHQLFALEAILSLKETPEGSRLEINDEYENSLVELFKALYALARETHIKQLEIPRPGAAPRPPPKKPTVWLAPALSIEPLASYYLRRAEAYSFLRRALAESFGASFEILPALEREESIFRAASSVALSELGLGDGGAALPSVGGFDRDLRMMVPVFFDVGRKRMKAWVFLGWRSRPLSSRFSGALENVRVFDARGRDVTAGVEVKYSAATYARQEPVVAEVYVERILDRDAFRALCDRHSTEREIISALSAK